MSPGPDFPDCPICGNANYPGHESWNPPHAEHARAVRQMYIGNAKAQAIRALVAQQWAQSCLLLADAADQQLPHDLILPFLGRVPFHILEDLAEAPCAVELVEQLGIEGDANVVTFPVGS